MPLPILPLSWKETGRITRVDEKTRNSAVNVSGKGFDEILGDKREAARYNMTISPNGAEALSNIS